MAPKFKNIRAKRPTRNIIKSGSTTRKYICEYEHVPQKKIRVRKDT